MSFLRSRTIRNLALFIFLASVATAPIWSVQYFVNQDGSGHAYGAWLITRLLSGDPKYTQLFQFNFILFPNSSGHWLQALLLQFVSAFTTTKIMATLTYSGLVAAIGWLRWQTVGNGVAMSLLIGSVLAFNSLWLVGFYNFTIGLIAAIVGTGLYFRWRGSMNAIRIVILALVLLFVFVSHAISFLILAAAVAALALFPVSFFSKRNLIATLISFVPVAIVAILYKLSSGSSGKFTPIWSSLKDPYSILNWINQLRAFDSFMIISRKSFPFVGADSTFFVIFTPLVWITIGFILLAYATWPRIDRFAKITSDRYFPFAVLFLGAVVLALVWPDFLKFENSTGGILRERVFLAGLIFLVPLFRMDFADRKLPLAATFVFAFVFLFQTAALSEYARQSDRDAREYVSANAHIPDGTSLAALRLDPAPKRFSSNAISSLDNYFAINRDILVWDNYEFGHYLFPVVLRSEDDRRFAIDYTSSNTYDLSDDEKLARVSSVFERDHKRIGTLLVWGSDPKVETVFRPYFESEPYFVNGRVRLFRHK